MRTLLLTSAALSALLMTAPVYAQNQGHHRDDTTPDTTTAAPAATPAATPDAPAATDNPTPLGGAHARNAHGHDNTPATTTTTPPPHGAPALIPGTPILAPGAGGQAHGTGHDNNSGHDNNTGRDNNAGRDNGRGDNNTGGNTGGSNPFTGRGGHAGQQHNNAFDALRRVLNAPHHYRHGNYHRPNGWYAHRWNYGEFLPALFFTRSYWISDYEDFDLPAPPPGTVWVRYGSDALLIDRYTGEVIEVEYGLFY